MCIWFQCEYKMLGPWFTSKTISSCYFNMWCDNISSRYDGDDIWKKNSNEQWSIVM